MALYIPFCQGLGYEHMPVQEHLLEMQQLSLSPISLSSHHSTLFFLFLYKHELPTIKKNVQLVSIKGSYIMVYMTY